MNTTKIPLIALGVFLVVAVLALYPSWSNKALLTTDGVHYLSTAENIAHGRGVHNYTGQVELAHPFGFSLIMAPLIRMGMDSQSAALTVTYLSLLVIGIMAFMLIRDGADVHDWRAIAGGAVVMLNPHLVLFSNWVLSEALCAALVLTLLWLCLRRSTWQNVLLTTLTAIALCFTRYPGIAIVLGFLVFVRSWRDRLIIGLPVVVISASAFFNTRGAHILHGTFWSNSRVLVHVPIGMMDVATGAGLFLLAVYLASRERWPVIARMVGAAIVLTAAGLTWSVVGFGVDPTMDLRLYVPVAGMLAVVLFILVLRQMPNFMPYVLTGLIFSTVVTLAPLWPIRYKMLNDQGLARSRTIQYVAALPESVPVYSTCPAAIWLYTGRTTKAITNTHYADKQAIRAAKDEPRETGGVMIWFLKFGHYGALPPDYYADIMNHYGEGQVEGFKDDHALVVSVYPARPEVMP